MFVAKAKRNENLGLRIDEDGMREADVGAVKICIADYFENLHHGWI